MESWVLLALASATLWAVVSLVDKTILERVIRHPATYLIISGASAVVPALLLPVFFDVTGASMPVAVAAAATGILYVFYNYLFFKSLQKSDASVVVNLWLLCPLFCTAWSLLFFGETLSLLVTAAIVTIVAGVAITSYSRDSAKTRLRGRIAALFMIGSAFVASIDYAIQDFLVRENTPLVVFYWSRVGVVISVLFLCLAIPQLRIAVFDLSRTVRLRAFSAAAINEALDMIATFSLIVAYAQGPLGPVTTIAATQPAFVLLFILVINRVRPSTIPSEGDERYKVRRAIGISITILGIGMISF